MKNSWKKVVAMMIAAALCVSCGVTGFSEDIQTDENTAIVEAVEAQNQEEPPKEEAPAQEPAPAPEPAPVQEPEPVRRLAVPARGRGWRGCHGLGRKGGGREHGETSLLNLNFNI